MFLLCIFVKGTIPQDAKAGVTFQFPCKEFVEKTGKTFKTRITQHETAVHIRQLSDLPSQYV